MSPSKRSPRRSPHRRILALSLSRRRDECRRALFVERLEQRLALAGEAFDYLAEPVSDHFNIPESQSAGPLQLEVLFNDKLSSELPNRITQVDLISSDAWGIRVTALRFGSTSSTTDPDLAAVTIAEDGKSILLDADPSVKYVGIRYIIDGLFSSTAWVSFDGNAANPDWYAFLQGAQPRLLNVTTNDLTSSTLVDGQWRPVPQPVSKIASVVQPESGGAVAISDDGTQLIFTPTANATGEVTLTYTNEIGEMATVNVVLTAVAKADKFRVPAGSAGQKLLVLLNDRITSDLGNQHITSVTQGDHGGSIVIAADGRSVLYTPAAGFSGVERFSYTLPGGAEGTVNVTVGGAEETFARLNREQIKERLIAQALVNYESMFGQRASAYGGWYGRPMWNIDMGAPNILAFAGAGDVVRATAFADSTNVQVGGVDEDDLVETDGQYIYSLANNQLVITRTLAGGALEIVHRESIDGTAVGIYRVGDRLVVLSQHNAQQTSRLVLADSAALPSPDQWWKGHTSIKVFDIADPAAPQRIGAVRIDGFFLASRRVDGNLVLVSQSQALSSPPELKLIDVEGETNPDGTAAQRYETRDEYLARMNVEFDAWIAARLPKFAEYDAAGNVVRQGLLNGDAAIAGGGADLGNQVNVTLVNVLGDAPTFVGSDASFLSSGWGHQVYATQDSVYVVQNAADFRESESIIQKFEFDAESGRVELAAQGTFRGRIIGRLAVSEHAGYLRIAVSDTLSTSDENAFWSGQAATRVIVMHDDGGLLEVAGATDFFAIGESARSVTFFENRAYVVTFPEGTNNFGLQLADPLFAIDLASPEQPAILGELVIPGFSGYLQMLDETHILGIGPDGENSDQIQLFDVSDPTNPIVLARFDLPDNMWARGVWGTAEDVIHSITWDAERGILSVPIADAAGWGWVRERDFTFLVLRVNLDATVAEGTGLVKLGEVVVHGYAARSLVIDDVLYVVGDYSITAADLDDLTQVLASVDIPQPPQEPASVWQLPETPVPPPEVTLVAPETTPPVAETPVEETPPLVENAPPIAETPPVAELPVEAPPAGLPAPEAIAETPVAVEETSPDLAVLLAAFATDEDPSDHADLFVAEEANDPFFIDPALARVADDLALAQTILQVGGGSIE